MSKELIKKDKEIPVKFKPRARLLLQLGEQLIRNESIALLEIVKNSYDADARNVDIYMDNIDNPKGGTIVIEDDGFGMDSFIIENVWMEPGSDYKSKLFEKGEVTPIYERLPIGEKGIGRFGVHKLGSEIEVISKKINKNEIYLKINWNKLNEFKYLEQVPFTLVERNSPKIYSTNKSGTSIKISDLKILWKRGIFRNIYRSLSSLVSPFKTNDSFQINFYTDKEKWLEGLLTWEEIKDFSLYNFKIEIEDNVINKFIYNFTPWTSLNKLLPRKITQDDEGIKKLKYIIDSNGNKFNLNKFNIGKIIIKGYIFDRDAKMLSLGAVSDRKGLKEYLDQNGGVRVYRDGMRVYDYGEPDNDWLELDIKRVNFPTKGLSNNIIISAVEIKREDSTDLKEKSNREGFVENEAFFAFKDSILYSLSLVESLRFIDKQKIRLFYGPTRKSEPVLESIGNLKLLIEENIKDVDQRENVINAIMKIEEDYKVIQETLLKSAGIGLNMSVYVHEIEKILLEVKKVVLSEKVSKRLTSLIDHLDNLIGGYAEIIRKSSKTKEDLKKIIGQALFNTEFRLKAHNISVISNYEHFKSDLKVKISRSLIIATLMNLIDNSIYWLDYSNTEKKKLFISITDDEEGYLSVILADNGTGFALPEDEIVKPFVTAKPLGAGMGLGLHLANEIMIAHKGKLTFPDWGDYEIPHDFKNGAIICLNFKL